MRFNFQSQAITLECSKSLGVINASDVCAACSQYHSSGVNRPRKRPTTGLINAAAVQELIPQLRENSHRERIVAAVFWRAQSFAHGRVSRLHLRTQPDLENQ